MIRNYIVEDPINVSRLIVYKRIKNRDFEKFQNYDTVVEYNKWKEGIKVQIIIFSTIKKIVFLMKIKVLVNIIFFTLSFQLINI